MALVGLKGGGFVTRKRLEEIGTTPDDVKRMTPDEQAQMMGWQAPAESPSVTLEPREQYQLRKLDRKIASLEKQIAAHEAVVNRGIQTPGWVVTGRSNRSRSLEKRHSQEVDRNSRAFDALQQAKKDLAYYTARRNGIAAGELAWNGQPKRNAPSRVKERQVVRTYAEKVRTILKPGDSVELWTGNRVRVKKVNAKTITTDSGTKWNLDEIRPVRNGAAMSPKDVMAA